MRGIWLGAMIMAGLVLVGAPATAHHSFAAQFDPNKPIKVTGTITSVRWSNPHGWIYIDVEEADGKVVNYAFEMGGLNNMYRRGWRKEDLPPGLEVTMDGYLSRTDPHVAVHQLLVLPDGRTLGSPVPGATNSPPPP